MHITIDEINDIINREAQGNGSLIAALEEIQSRYRFRRQIAIAGLYLLQRRDE